MSKVQLIELQTKVEGKDTKFTGRFLGFIKDDEFNALIHNTEKVAARLESKATQPLMEIAAKFDDVVGHRLIMVVKKLDGVNVIGKQLFITEGLTMIDSVVPRDNKHWDGVKRMYIEKPGKVTFQAGEDDNIVVQEAE